MAAPVTSTRRFHGAVLSLTTIDSSIRNVAAGSAVTEDSSSNARMTGSCLSVTAALEFFTGLTLAGWRGEIA